MAQSSEARIGDLTLELAVAYKTASIRAGTILDLVVERDKRNAENEILRKRVEALEKTVRDLKGSSLDEIQLETDKPQQ
jgi:cell division protein FtsB